MGLDGKGVAVVGEVPAGLPRLRWPEFDPEFIRPLLGGALGVALLSFSNAMVVARSFAAKGGYEVDANQEFSPSAPARLRPVSHRVSRSAEPSHARQ